MASFCKYFLSVCVCVFLTLFLAVPTNANAYYAIRSINDFFTFARVVNKTVDLYQVVLETDLDFSSASSSFYLPLGMPLQGNCNPFFGVFEGNRHMISGLVINNGQAGLFCDTSFGIIQNLIIDKTCSFSGENAGSVAGLVSGKIMLVNVINRAAIDGKYAGGLIGVVCGNNAAVDHNITISHCQNDGSVHGLYHQSHSIGGIIGRVAGTSGYNFTIVNTTNNGNVTGSEFNGGFVGTIVGNTNLIFRITNSKNYGTCTNIQDSGSVLTSGFIGIIRSNVMMNMAIDGAVNNGDVITSTNATSTSFSGGIIAFIDTSPLSTILLSNCVNNGINSGSGIVRQGGIIGIFREGSENANVKLLNNNNNGAIKTVNGGGVIGGIIGMVQCPAIFISSKGDVNNASLVHEGNLGNRIGGIIGAVQANEGAISVDCGTNNGKISGVVTDIEAGGIIGWIMEPASSVRVFLTNCRNNGEIQACSGNASGLLGVSDYSPKVTVSLRNSINKGHVCGNMAYAMCKTAYYANNLVSTGEIFGKSSTSFLEKCSNQSSLFAQQDFAMVTTFAKDNNGHYVLQSDNGVRVDRLLNNMCSEKQYELGWTEELEFSNNVVVWFDAPLNSAYYLFPGYSLDSIPNLPSNWNRTHWYDDSGLEYTASSKVWVTVLHLTGYYHVSFGDPFSRSFNVTYGRKLGSIEWIAWKSYHWWDSSGKIYDESSSVENDLDLSRFCTVTFTVPQISQINVAAGSVLNSSLLGKWCNCHWRNGGEVFNVSSEVTNDLTLKGYYNVTFIARDVQREFEVDAGSRFNPALLGEFSNCHLFLGSEEVYVISSEVVSDFILKGYYYVHFISPFDERANVFAGDTINPSLLKNWGNCHWHNGTETDEFLISSAVKTDLELKGYYNVGFFSSQNKTIEVAAGTTFDPNTLDEWRNCHLYYSNDTEYDVSSRVTSDLNLRGYYYVSFISPLNETVKVYAGSTIDSSVLGEWSNCHWHYGSGQDEFFLSSKVKADLELRGYYNVYFIATHNKTIPVTAGSTFNSTMLDEWTDCHLHYSNDTDYVISSKVVSDLELKGYYYVTISSPVNGRYNVYAGNALSSIASVQWLSYHWWQYDDSECDPSFVVNRDLNLTGYCHVYFGDPIKETGRIIPGLELSFVILENNGWKNYSWWDSRGMIEYSASSTISADVNLTRYCTVHFGNPLDESVKVAPGSSLDKMSPQLDNWGKYHWLLDNDTVCDKSTIVVNDMELFAYFYVWFVPLREEVLIVPFGKSFSSVIPSELLAFHWCYGNGTQCDLSSTVMSDVKLIQCFSVSVGGEKNCTGFVRSGSTLLDLACIDSSAFSQFIITEVNKPGEYLNQTMKVVYDMDIIVKKKVSVEIVFDFEEGNEEEARSQISLFMSDNGFSGKDIIVSVENNQLVVTVVVSEDDSESLVDIVSQCQN